MLSPLTLLGRTGLYCAAFYFTTAGLRADFTQNLVARWTFNQPGENGLLDDIKGVPFKVATYPAGAAAASPLPSNGVIELHNGAYLVATDLVKGRETKLARSLTLWARLRIDGAASASTGFLLGLVSKPAPGDWDDVSLVLIHRPETMKRNVGFTSLARLENGRDFSLGERTVPDSTGRFVNVALVFNAHTGTLTLWIDGVVETAVRSDIVPLQPAAALMLGRLKQAAGPDATFDEVRLYDIALSPEWLGDISPVANP